MANFQNGTTFTPYAAPYTPFTNSQPQYPYQPAPQFPQQPPVTPSFNGRTINSPDEIKPSEVPMDGRISIFPLNDLSAIFVKAWNSNGVMMTARFAFDPSWQNPPAATQDDILRRLEALEARAKPKKKEADNSGS